MECTRATSFPQLLAILSLILLTFDKSLSHADRQVVEVSNVVASTHEKEFAVPHGDNSLSLQKENIVDGDVPSAAAEVKPADSYKIGGRRMSYNDDQKMKGMKKGQKTEASFALIHGDGNTKRKQQEEEEHWKEGLMAFTVDYSSPRAHPPSNN